jgi:hypothetical protein
MLTYLVDIDDDAATGKNGSGERRVGDLTTWKIALGITSVVPPTQPAFVLEYACYDILSPD